MGLVGSGDSKGNELFPAGDCVRNSRTSSRVDAECQAGSFGLRSLEVLSPDEK